MTALEFVRERASEATRTQNAMVAVYEAASIAVIWAVAASYGLSGWVHYLLAVATVLLLLTGQWVLLGFGSVQRWIRGGERP